jgi:hypothetical protein
MIRILSPPATRITAGFSSISAGMWPGSAPARRLCRLRGHLHALRPRDAGGKTGSGMPACGSCGGLRPHTPAGHRSGFRGGSTP